MNASAAYALVKTLFTTTDGCARRENLRDEEVGYQTVCLLN